MTNILITGAGGQLANEIKFLTTFNDFKTCHFFFESKKDLNITNKHEIETYFNEKKFKGQKINYVINCAAYTAVDAAEENYDMAELINGIGPLNLAEICNKEDATLIHISTDYVFDGTANKPISPNNKCNPLGVYGMTKYHGEQNIINNTKKYFILRTSWLFSGLTANNFVGKMVKRAMNGESVKVVNDQTGSPTNARDLAKMILFLINTHFKYGVYHFANQGTATWFDVTNVIYNIVHPNEDSYKYVKACKSTDFKTIAKRPSYSVFDLDNTLVEQYKPQHWISAVQNAAKEIIENIKKCDF